MHYTTDCGLPANFHFGALGMQENIESTKSQSLRTTDAPSVDSNLDSPETPLPSGSVEVGTWPDAAGGAPAFLTASYKSFETSCDLSSRTQERHEETDGGLHKRHAPVADWAFRVNVLPACSGSAKKRDEGRLCLPLCGYKVQGCGNCFVPTLSMAAASVDETEFLKAPGSFVIVGRRLFTS